MHPRAKYISSSDGGHADSESIILAQSEPSLPKSTTPRLETRPWQSTLSVAPSDAPIQSTVPGRRFEATSLIKSPSNIISGLPPELWTPILSTPSLFPPSYFIQVSQNLLKNPNLTSSHLFRAEIFYDSQKDASFNPSAQSSENLSDFIPHMKAEYRPLIVPGGFPGYELSWTVVRKLIPRNPQLDKPLVQTCHLFTSTNTRSVQELDGAKPERHAHAEHTFTEERSLIVYLPHATIPNDIPWYHPPVRALATLYIWSPESPSPSPPGNLSLYYNLFSDAELSNRMERTALNLLKIIHKHGHGQQEGYTKRVHHDIVVPQKRFQDMYTYLKGKYAKTLIRGWVEQTLATKHVFEDLGIAAFLIELWTEMYGDSESLKEGERRKELETGLNDAAKADAQKKFPGFVDIGCGNGLLVYVLLKEGWDGWGFDARRRKTWDTFPADAQEKLKEMLLVPEIFQSSQSQPLSENLSRSPTPFWLATAASSEISKSLKPMTTIGSDSESLGALATPSITISSKSLTSPLAFLPLLQSPHPNAAAATASPSAVSDETSTSAAISHTSDLPGAPAPKPSPDPLTSAAPESHSDFSPPSPIVPTASVKSLAPSIHSDTRARNTAPPFHNGVFPTGTFIVSNHADELTPWTPLLASLSCSPFIAIPCCSHNFAGARFRAPSTPVPTTKPPTHTHTHSNSHSHSHHASHHYPSSSTGSEDGRLEQADGSSESNTENPDDRRSSSSECESQGDGIVESKPEREPKADSETKDKHAPEHALAHGHKCNDPGCKLSLLKANPKPAKAPKPPSAYAALCAWVEKLAAEVGYVIEKEMLRIPSTRNAAIIGRKWTNEEEGVEEREERVRGILEREMGVGLEAMGKEWVDRVRKLWEKDGIRGADVH